MLTAHCFDLTPNCSLSLRGARLFLASVCVPTLGVAGAATAMGYWPILPFAGAEILLLVWALKTNMARRFEHEHIEVGENEVTIEYSHDLAPALRRRVVFPRHWAQVKIRRPKSPLHRGQLVIESHGRSHEVGTFLTEEERRHLAAQLKLLIGGMNQSPALPCSGSPDQFS
ncbi:MAG TPA: DUF2244 domain-containing protein [Steroidobacteraceae bacterium]|nr:DUF2244 domain-containing protein [Steroidobacteraceae bacterium]